MKKLIPLTSLILLSAGPSFADVSGFFENIIVIGQKTDNVSDQEKWAIEFKQGLYGERNINGVELTTLCILGACPDYDVKCIGENHDKCAAFVQGFLGHEQETPSTSTHQESTVTTSHESYFKTTAQETTTAPSVTTVSATSETPRSTSDATSCDPNKLWNYIPDPKVGAHSYENQIRQYSRGVYQPETRGAYQDQLEFFKSVCEENGGTYTIKEETFTEVKNICGTYNKYQVVYCRFPECDKTRGLVRCRDIFGPTIGRGGYSVYDDGTCGSRSNIGCSYTTF